MVTVQAAMSSFATLFLTIFVWLANPASQTSSDFRRGEWEEVTKSKFFITDQVSHACVRNGTVEEVLAVGPPHPCTVVDKHSDGALISLTMQCKGNEKVRDFQSRIQVVVDSDVKAHGNMQLVINKNGVPTAGDAQFTLRWVSDRCTGE